MFDKKNSKNILRQPKIYSPPREQEPFVLPKFLKLIALVVICLLLIIYLLFFSPLFQIKNIELVGSNPTEIKNRFEEFKDQNIFLFPAHKIENELRNFPQFSKVEVFRGIPNTLKIKFQEREKQIIWRSNNREYWIDNEGISFEEKETGNSSNFPIVSDNKNLEVKIPMQVATGRFVNFIKSAKSELGKLSLDVYEFQVNETIFQVDALTNQGFKIIFDVTRPLSDQIDALEKVYKDHRDEIQEYVDVRVEGWVYYK